MKNIKNGKQNTDQVVDNAVEGLVLPPSADSGALKGPKKFDTIGDVIREQQRIYKMVFDGELALNDLSKLMYALQNLIQGIKAKAEIDQLEDMYSKQWQGVRIIAPDGAELLQITGPNEDKTAITKQKEHEQQPD